MGAKPASSVTLKPHGESMLAIHSDGTESSLSVVADGLQDSEGVGCGRVGKNALVWSDGEKWTRLGGKCYLNHHRANALLPELFMIRLFSPPFSSIRSMHVCMYV